MYFYFVVKRERAQAITEDMKNFKAFQAIRQARAYKRLHGARYLCDSNSSFFYPKEGVLLEAIEGSIASF